VKGARRGATVHSTAHTSPHPTVLDTNCVLHQIDFLESAGSSGAFSNVVIPQTVMNEIRGLNVSVYNRMHTLLQVCAARRCPATSCSTLLRRSSFV
jgi:hypothetical protein